MTRNCIYMNTFLPGVHRFGINWAAPHQWAFTYTHTHAHNHIERVSRVDPATHRGEWFFFRGVGQGHGSLLPGEGVSLSRHDEILHLSSFIKPTTHINYHKPSDLQQRAHTHTHTHTHTYRQTHRETHLSPGRHLSLRPALQLKFNCGGRYRCWL